MSVGEYYLLLWFLIAIPCFGFLAWVKHQDKKESNKNHKP